MTTAKTKLLTADDLLRLDSEDMDTSGYPEVAPDLVVDVSSNKDDDLQMLHEKALMWIGFGVKLVWVAHPDESMRTIDVYRAGGALTTLSEGDTLDGGDVLSGFSPAT